MNQRNVTIFKGMISNFLQHFGNKELELSFRTAQTGQYTLYKLMSTFLIAAIAAISVVQIIILPTNFKTFLILPLLLLIFLANRSKTTQMLLIHLIYSLGLVLAVVFFIDSVQSTYHLTITYVASGILWVFLADFSLLWYTKFTIQLISSLVLLFLPEESQQDFLKLMIFLPFQIILGISFYHSERVRRLEFMNGVTKANHVLTWEKLISDAFPSPAFILNYASNAPNSADFEADGKEGQDGELSIPFWNKAFTKLMSEIDPQYASPLRRRGGEGSPARGGVLERHQTVKNLKRGEIYQQDAKKEESRSIKEHSSAKDFIVIKNSSVKILSSVSYNEIPSPLAIEQEVEQAADERQDRAKTPKHERNAPPFISLKTLKEGQPSQKSVDIYEMASAPVIRLPSIQNFLGNFTLLKDKLSQQDVQLGDKRLPITGETLTSLLHRIANDLDPVSPSNSMMNRAATATSAGMQAFPGKIPGQILQEKKVMIRVQNEEPKVFEMRICSCNWAGKQSALVIFNDISEKILNERLKRLDEYKDSVLSTVSHDFRTPLTIMIQLLDSMIANYDAPASAPTKTSPISAPQMSSKEDLQLCNSSANLLLSYVNDILDLAQIRQQKLQITKTSFDLTKTMDQVMKLLSFQASAKKINLLLDSQLEPLKNQHVPGSFSPRRGKPGFIVYNDERRLKQILINLIGNALKFTSNGSIKVAAKLSHKHGGTLKFSVEDTGIGIKRDDLPKLFKPYSKLKPHEKINKNGVGLGLVICKNFVSLMGPLKGLKVKSTVGVGSKFIFYVYYKDQNQVYEDEMKVKTPIEEEELMNCVDELGRNEVLVRQMPSIPFMSDERVNVNINHLGDRTPIKASLQYVSDSNSPSFAVPTQKQQPEGREMEKRIKILAVDDHPFNLMALEKGLSIASHASKCMVELIMTHNGLEAVQVMKEQGADLVLLDCEMPIMDGFECAKILSKMMKDGEMGSVPIIAMTAHQSEVEKLKCLKSGMTGFISKPAPSEELQKIIERALQVKSCENLEEKADKSPK